jgi:hypothetical protein|uniref:Uncharacterized protein n=1 Tax=Picea glauca TaxID=3330 RepID=A0A101LYR1_PICGL|nr:hypothetical protein ABT39_MTgene5947 [Picea glauca]
MSGLGYGSRTGRHAAGNVYGTALAASDSITTVSGTRSTAAFGSFTCGLEAALALVGGSDTIYNAACSVSGSAFTGPGAAPCLWLCYWLCSCFLPWCLNHYRGWICYSCFRCRSLCLCEWINWLCSDNWIKLRINRISCFFRTNWIYY